MNIEQLREEQRLEIVRTIASFPRVAHSILFKHRHPNGTPAFHAEVIDLLHNAAAHQALIVAFRGSAKSTLAEEAILIRALLKRYRNGLLIGATEDRAKDRLRSIKHELETNLFIENTFGAQQGETWQEKKIVLTNGVVIQAHGQGQALRGVKHLDARPDFVFIDDLEEKEDVASPDARHKLASWFYADLLAALEPGSLVRMAATPLDPEALAVKLSQSKSWTTRTYPIEHIAPDGQRQATWPERFPLSFIDAKKEELFKVGQTATWEQEYMVRAVDPATRVFTEDLMRCEPQVRQPWYPTYAVYDPARTVKATSATTGKIVASVINNRMLVWEASANMWLPDQIVDDMFDTDTRYSPIALGVEEDGLHEFIMQPLRHAQVTRRHLLPIRPLKAPKGKLDFIRALQPFFKAREIVFAGDRPEFADTIAQFLSFPTGRIDVPNALAYILNIKAGVPIYENFSPAQHVVEDIRPPPRAPLYLAVNATPQLVTAVLVEDAQGTLNIVADFVEEGDAGSALAAVVRAAQLVCARQPTVYAPRSHFNTYDNTGLRAAARSALVELRRGGDPYVGQNHLRDSMVRLSRGGPAFRVSSKATWVLRALAGGYARPIGKDKPVEGAYSLLMEGLEAFVATFQRNETVDTDVRYATTSDGRQYISARAT